MRKFLVLIGLVVFTLTVQAGQIYKWRDDNGTLHFSKIPPQDPELLIETIELKPLNTMKPTPTGKPKKIVGSPTVGKTTPVKPKGPEEQK